MNDSDIERTPPTRRLVRERVMQTLYAYELGHAHGGETVEFLAAQIVQPELKGNSDLMEFAQDLMRRVLNNLAELDGIIRSLAENWDFSRIAPIDKVLLRMGITEILYFPEIPARVTINEVIEIAKRYSTDKSGIFLNGVLDGVLAKLKKEGRFKKSGRGLLGEE